MGDEDCWAVRAELEARKEEIATLRGVVAALRTLRHDGARERRKQPEHLVTCLVVSVAAGVVTGVVVAAAIVVWRCS